MAPKMSETDGFLGVPEAAVAAGVSERTMWRWVRDGAVTSQKVGRRRLVRLRAPGVTRVGEAAALYGPDEPYLPDPSAPIPWPYTPERLEDRRRWLLEERRAAGAEMDRLAVPVERGYVERLIREVRDENRAWDGLLRGEKAIRARASRRARQ
jgi:malate synthase